MAASVTAAGAPSAAVSALITSASGLSIEGRQLGTPGDSVAEHPSVGTPVVGDATQTSQARRRPLERLVATGGGSVAALVHPRILLEADRAGGGVGEHGDG